MPDSLHPTAWTETYTLMARFPFEPRPKPKTLRGQSYPGAIKYTAQEGDTLESIMKAFYGQITPAGRRAIIDANEVFRRAKAPSDIVVLPYRAYWIPWNPAENHTFCDFMAEVNKAILRNPRNFAGPIDYRYAWWETPNYVYEIAMLGSFLVVGLFWPAFLFVMRKGGPAHKHINHARPLSRSGKPEVQPDGSTVTIRDIQQLHEVQESLMTSLKRSDSSNPPKGAIKTEMFNKNLDRSDADQTAAPMPATEESKEYDGEFYPVVKPHGPLKQ